MLSQGKQSIRYTVFMRAFRYLHAVPSLIIQCRCTITLPGAEREMKGGQVTALIPHCSLICVGGITPEEDLYAKTSKMSTRPARTARASNAEHECCFISPLPRAYVWRFCAVDVRTNSQLWISSFNATPNPCNNVPAIATFINHFTSRVIPLDAALLPRNRR